jgi:putative ABC transport system permease protein
MNWLSQILSIALFNLRTIPERKGAAISAAFGIAGVVGVLVGVLAIAEGFRRVMSVSGTPDVAIVLRSGADTEMTSGLSRDEVRVISDAPGIARVANGVAASAELFVIIDLPKRSTGTPANVPLRGVDPAAFDVRGNITMVQGRRFEPGRNEIVVGTGAAREFAGLELGKELRVGLNTWTVVGIFSANGSVSESEVWSDGAVLRSAYQRGENFQSVYVRLSSAAAFEPFKDALTTNPQLKVKVSRLSDFYSEQSTMITDFITTLGVFIAGMMALGALFGALNTMYSAVAARTREIATLRALGFGSSPVIFSVLTESVVLALLGGAFGGAVSYALFNGFTATTMNFQTFSQVTFAFAVTPKLMLRAILWAVTLGLLGGILPAIRAARMPIAQGLREP